MNTNLSRLLVALVTLGCFCGCRQQELRVLRIAQLCDPQLGFVEGGFDSDVGHFKKAVLQINELAPDLVVVAGDMVNDGNNDEAINIFKSIIDQIKAPVLLAAGNHDMPDPVTVAGLKRYRTHYGDDYQAIECKGRSIIVVNTQLWREAPPEESRRHDVFLQENLQKAKKKQQAVVLLSHVPPFVSSVDEPDEYFNLPESKRKDILRLCDENGVIIWLAGHTHKTSRRDYRHITILNGETTGMNFDNHPAGFRLLTIYPDQSFDWDFVALKNDNK